MAEEKYYGLPDDEGGNVTKNYGKSWFAVRHRQNWKIESNQGVEIAIIINEQMAKRIVYLHNDTLDFIGVR